MKKYESIHSKRHHSNYVSNQDAIHKCFITYYDELFQNMPFQWYVQNIHDSCARKGFIIPIEEVEDTVKHFLQQRGRTICTHCWDKWQ